MKMMIIYISLDKFSACHCYGEHPLSKKNGNILDICISRLPSLQ